MVLKSFKRQDRSEIVRDKIELGKASNSHLAFAMNIWIDEPEPRERDYAGSPGGLQVVSLTVNEYSSAAALSHGRHCV